MTLDEVKREKKRAKKRAKKERRKTRERELASYMSSFSTTHPFRRASYFVKCYRGCGLLYRQDCDDVLYHAIEHGADDLEFYTVHDGGDSDADRLWEEDWEEEWERTGKWNEALAD